MLNEYFKRDYQHIKVKKCEADSHVKQYKKDGYKLLSYSESEPGYIHLYFEKYFPVDQLEDCKLNDQDKMIHATRKSNITKQTLLDVFAEKGLVGVYNLGLKNMLDYLKMEKLSKEQFEKCNNFYGSKQALEEMENDN